MSQPNPSVPTTTTLAQRRLGVWAIVFFVVSAAAPLTVVASAAVTLAANSHERATNFVIVFSCCSLSVKGYKRENALF